MKQVTFTIENDEGEEVEVSLPGKYEVCWRCRGEGTHCNPAIDGNGITASDFAEDPDFRDSYFAGHYDVRCEECHGDRVTLVVDEEQADKALLAQYHAQLREEREYQQVCEAERRMGA